MLASAVARRRDYDPDHDPDSGLGLSCLSGLTTRPCRAVRCAALHTLAWWPWPRSVSEWPASASAGRRASASEVGRSMFACLHVCSVGSSRLPVWSGLSARCICNRRAARVNAIELAGDERPMVVCPTGGQVQAESLGVTWLVICQRRPAFSPVACHPGSLASPASPASPAGSSSPWQAPQPPRRAIARRCFYTAFGEAGLQEWSAAARSTRVSGLSTR